MKTKTQVNLVTKETGRSLSKVVGEDTYAVWVRILRKLVPDGRTHRLAVMVAGMLQHAVVVAAAKRDEREDERSLAPLCWRPAKRATRARSET